MADVGEPKRKIDFEPIPEEAPVEAPSVPVEEPTPA